ncbi:hypothetical protein DFJ73DRAFT_774629 [Zopfochytrium polystomum]|nr:hypothetical protein DFJ73DRAFT_774629 [Zopfochytrium polystomum]
MQQVLQSRLGPVAKTVLVLQMCQPRVMDFMARKRWLVVVAVFQRHVLDHCRYLEHVLN